MDAYEVIRKHGSETDQTKDIVKLCWNLMENKYLHSDTVLCTSFVAIGYSGQKYPVLHLRTSNNSRLVDNS